MHGYDAVDALINLAPRPGEFTLRTEDVIDTIRKRGSEIALVMFSGVQFYTGQRFEIQKITAAAREQVCRLSSKIK